MASARRLACGDLADLWVLSMIKLRFGSEYWEATERARGGEGVWKSALKWHCSQGRDEQSQRPLQDYYTFVLEKYQKTPAENRNLIGARMCTDMANKRRRNREKWHCCPKSYSQSVANAEVDLKSLDSSQVSYLSTRTHGPLPDNSGNAGGISPLFNSILSSDFSFIKVINQAKIFYGRNELQAAFVGNQDLLWNLTINFVTIQKFLFDIS